LLISLREETPLTYFDLRKRVTKVALFLAQQNTLLENILNLVIMKKIFSQYSPKTGYSLTVWSSGETWKAVFKYNHPNMGKIQVYEFFPSSWSTTLRSGTLESAKQAADLFPAAPFIHSEELWKKYDIHSKALELNLIS
jgi:hypothetical protein